MVTKRIANNKKGFVPIIIVGILFLAAGVAFGYTYGTNRQAVECSIDEIFNGNECKAFQDRVIELREYLDDGSFRDVSIMYYDSPEEVPYDYDYAKESLALYSPSRKVIYVNEDKIEGDRMIYTLIHEYGHYIWYEVMTEEERNEYSEIYEDATEFSTKYAITGGAMEDFADSYRNYMLGYNVPNDRLGFFSKVKQKYVKVF